MGVVNQLRSRVPFLRLRALGTALQNNRNYLHTSGEWVLRLVDTPVEGEAADEVWTFSFPGLATSPEELEDQFVEAVIKPSAAQDCFITSTRKSRFEWGASAASWEVLIDFAIGLASAGTYDVLRAIALRFCSRRGAGPLSRADALSQAEHAVVLRYQNVAADDLATTSEESESDDTWWTFEFETEGPKFRVTIDNREGLHSIKIKREQSGRGAITS